MILFPLAIVSNALVPTQHMPAVVRTIAEWNPVSAVTAASPQPVRQPEPSGGRSCLADAAPGAGGRVWSLALLVVFAPLATRLYRTRTAD